MPSFPVNIQSTRSSRETSPTNKGSGMFNSSPTSSLTIVGRRSPNHDQMDAIAEDTTEELTTPTNIHPPTVIQSSVVDEPPNLQSRLGEGGGGLSPNMGSNGSFQGYLSRSTTPEEGRQRRTGFNALKSPVSPQMVFSFIKTGDLNAEEGSGESGNKKSAADVQGSVPQVNGGLHHLLAQPSVAPPAASSSAPSSITNGAQVPTMNGNSSTLLGMLKSPVTISNEMTSVPHPHQLQQQQQQLYQHQQTLHHIMNSEQSSPYSSSNNYRIVQAAFPTTVSAATAIQPISCAQQMQKVSAGDLLISQISSLLDHSGISYVHQNNIISVQHPGVHFQIHITNTVQTSFIAGDANQYQSLCSQLFSRLGPSVQ